MDRVCLQNIVLTKFLVSVLNDPGSIEMLDRAKETVNLLDDLSLDDIDEQIQEQFNSEVHYVSDYLGLI